MGFSADEITNLRTVRSNLISAAATWSGESPITGSYTIAGRTHEYRSLDEIMRAIENIGRLIDSATAGNPASRVSYGRMRRYR